MIELIAQALDFLLQPCYQLTNNWWVAIALFTLITKITLFPLALWCQKNSLIMVQLMPELFRIKVKYFGDKDTIGEKQNELYKEKHYHALLSLIPLAIQIVILFGLVDVVHSITDYGAPGTEFLGMVPIEDGGLSWIMPVLAGLSAVLLGFAQNRINPLQKEQSRAEKNMTNGLSIGLSLVLGIFVAAGMAFYWIISNLSAILIQALCNLCMPPKKYIDYDDLNAARDEFEALNSLDAETKKPWYKPDPLRKRERADYKRFNNILNKHIVFYSEGSGFYKYFKGAIEWLLSNSDAIINYVTNDPNDQIFEIAESCPRIKPYYIGPKKIITLMMKMDADIVCTTLEDLDTFYLKRSYILKDIHYVFFFHHMTSTHLTATPTAYDSHDALLCVGPHQVSEVRKAEALRNLPAKELVEAGYPLLDENIANYAKIEARQINADRKPTIMIGPSWQEDCIPDSCIDEIIERLLLHDWFIIVRPHPEYVKRYKAKWQAILNRWSHIPEDKLYFEKDFSSNESVYTSDILITDWSTVAYEFSLTTDKPSIFVNTKMKVGNQNFRELGIEPTDITWRDELGISIDKENISSIDAIIEQTLSTSDEWNERIRTFAKQNIFNISQSAEVQGRYLLDKIIQIQDEHGRGTQQQEQQQ